MKVLIPDLVPFQQSIAGVQVVVFDPTQPIPDQHLDADGLVVWGMSDERVFEAAAKLRQLNWVQLLSAGSDVALAAGFVKSAAIMSGRSLHDGPVAEHALALILAAARSLHVCVRSQVGKRWANELGGARVEPDPAIFTTLRGAHVVIWGYGSIGSLLGQHLRALGARVTGVARTARNDGDVQVVSVAELPEVLPTADVLAMVLPHTTETEAALSADLIRLLPSRAWLVNVGRGATVDEPALIEALSERRIGGAALDVTSVEPLPTSSPLWELPNVIITPHTAGGRPVGSEDLIAQNLARAIAGGELRNLVRGARP